MKKGGDAMTLKAAFIFIAPDADPIVNKSVIDTGNVNLTTIGVRSYEQAVIEAIKLVNDGVKTLELCGGFGHMGVGMVSEAVKGKSVVGVVRFDTHPSLNNKSGDELF